MSNTLNLEIFLHTTRSSNKSPEEYVEFYNESTQEITMTLDKAIRENNQKRALESIQVLFCNASALGGVKILEYLEEIEDMLISGTADCHSINVFQIKILSKALAKACSKVYDKPTHTVLLIDDSRMPLLLGSKLLEKEGMKTLTANCGRRGIESFKENISEIDIVITDLFMPDINGDVVYREIKELSPETPVLLATGYEDSTSSKESKTNFADGCIKKPLSYTKLLEAISPLL